jgi:UDP:flavonoid glycosyltransferase YjiC (YdhE family)
VLREAAAVVTHGGHGTVIRALAAGVPALVLPHGRDQADNAARVRSRGAGLQLKSSAPPRAIAAAVQRLLAEPGFREGAERLGETVRRDAASGMLVRELEDLPAAVAAP